MELSEGVSGTCPLEAELAQGLRDAREELTRRWLDRVAARVQMDPNRVFPTEELLDHIPMLLIAVADYIEDPAEEITADAPVVAKAMELGELRYEQGFDLYEILKEYEILGGVLFAFLIRIVDTIPKPCSRSELLTCAHRLFRGLAVIQQVTSNHYQRVLAERVRERENRLRRFNRMVSHELRNRIGGVMNAGRLLSNEWLEGAERERFAHMVTENARGIVTLMDDLTQLSRIDAEARLQRDILLPQAAAEVARQLRDFSQARGVEIRLADDLPEVGVNAAAVELCLSNYLSNAIKYADPRKGERWAEVRGRVREPDADGASAELVIEVRDNGIGVPETARSRLFEAFYRAHEETVTGQEGTGLGLSIVRDTVEALGGRAWAEFPEEGSSFAFSIPLDGRSEESDRSDVGSGARPEKL